MNEILHGDCLEVMKTLEANSVDVVVTDPPYGYSFMGKDWDKAVPSVGVWKECLRVLKPGGFAFVMSAPRQDVLSQMIVRIGQAGFNTNFTSIYWTYASGFPKAANVGKVVDKRLGTFKEGAITKNARFGRAGDEGNYNHSKVTREFNAQSNQAKALDGSYGGFQPKPAVEVIIVAMKPLSEKTFVDQALKNGKGITWLDDCRVPTNELAKEWGGASNPQGYKEDSGGDFKPDFVSSSHDGGRFPANLIVSQNVLAENSRYFDLDAWAKTLPFLIVPKASKREKNEGLDAREKVTVGDGRPVAIDNAFQRGKTERQNSHPTVKPLKLMSYLITLGSRPGDVVLEPFAGSGTTCIAAKHLNRRYIGIEREAEYVEIARARLTEIQPTLF